MTISQEVRAGFWPLVDSGANSFSPEEILISLTLRALLRNCSLLL